MEVVYFKSGRIFMWMGAEGCKGGNSTDLEDHLTRADLEFALDLKSRLGFTTENKTPPPEEIPQ